MADQFKQPSGKSSAIDQVHQHVFAVLQVMTAEVGKTAHSGEEVLALKKLISKCNIDNDKLKDVITVNKSRDEFLLRFRWVAAVVCVHNGQLQCLDLLDALSCCGRQLAAAACLVADLEPWLSVSFVLPYACGRFPVPDDDFEYARKAYEWPKRFSDVLREAGTKAAAEHRQFETALKTRRKEFDKRIEQYAAEVTAVEGRADIVKREVVASEVGAHRYAALIRGWGLMRLMRLATPSPGGHGCCIGSSSLSNHPVMSAPVVWRFEREGTLISVQSDHTVTAMYQAGWGHSSDHILLVTVCTLQVTDLQTRLQAAVQEAEEINTQEKMFGWGLTK